MKTKFNVGDIIKGNSPSRYAITNCNALLKVTAVSSSGNIISARVLETNDSEWIEKVGKEYTDLEVEFFDFVFSGRPVNVKVPLNKDYTAIITKDGEVKVGCQTFHASVIRDFIQKYNEITA